jgi:chromosomal replication initiator protein
MAWVTINAKDSSTVTPKQLWDAAQAHLELQLDRNSYDTWLRGVSFIDFVADDALFILGVANPYAQEMLQHRLYPVVRRALINLTGSAVELRFELIKKREPVEPVVSADEDMPLFKLLRQRDPHLADEQDQPSFEEVVRTPRVNKDLPHGDLNPKYVFERFIVNRSNQMAYEAARAVAEFPSTVYNPYFIHSSTGLGKTHLLQAIAHECVRRGLKTLYVTSEVFTNEFMEALRTRTTAMFQQKYRTVDVLLVDDVQFIAGKESTQEEFFHTFNALYQANRQIVLSSDQHPSQIITLDDRLRSRFTSGLIADVATPEYETRRIVLGMWAKERQATHVSPEALDTLASKGARNFRELEGLFLQVIAQSRLGKINPNNPQQLDMTIETFQSPRERYTMERILEATAQKFSVCAEDLTTNKRAAVINTARQVAMYLAREFTVLSLAQIGAHFGRNHTTVLHGCSKVAEVMEKDKLLAQRVQAIRRALQES